MRSSGGWRLALTGKKRLAGTSVREAFVYRPPVELRTLKVKFERYKAAMIMISLEQKDFKSNFYCSRGITAKRVTSGGIHLRGLAPEQQSSEETSQR